MKSPTTQQLARALPVVTFSDEERGELRVEWFFDAVTTDEGPALNHSLVELHVRREFDLKRSVADGADRYDYRVAVNWSAIGECDHATAAVFMGAVNEATDRAKKLEAVLSLWRLSGADEGALSTAIFSVVRDIPNRDRRVPAHAAYLGDFVTKEAS